MSEPQENAQSKVTLAISELLENIRNGSVEAKLAAQVSSIDTRQTRLGKPYLVITLRDATGQLNLKIWSDHPQFNEAIKLQLGDVLSATGTFSFHPEYGFDTRHLSFGALSKEERDSLFTVPRALREKLDADYADVERLIATIDDPRFATLCSLFLKTHGVKFRRTAAARFYHHNYRGGLVGHTAQIMRTADAVSRVYPQINRDLLLAGALLHDCGKIWETCPPEFGFEIPYEVRGELLGHIVIGIEVVNALWRELTSAPEHSSWKTLKPSNEDARLHLLHLIASHHGELEFGSPVMPKTPEANVLHVIDKLDAQLESVNQALRKNIELGEGIIERVRPLACNLVRPLPQIVKLTG